MQRLLDIFFSFCALAFLSPIFIIVTLVLRFTGEGEIFFFQERIGRNKEVFKLLKFVTMLKNSESMGTGTLTVKDDPRILPLGKLLRKTKINELPQLLNVFFGQMSVVGPRPLTSDSFNCYSEQIQNKISKVKPGLSGIGSIIFRDEENILSDKDKSKEFYKDSIAPYKGSLESWYINNYNIRTYFKVIIATVWVILFSSSSLALRLFKDLPEPSSEIKDVLKWNS